MRSRLPALVLALLPLAGAASIDQPIPFSHKRHIAHFASGAHRESRIRMHLELLGEEEPPPEIVEGECNVCHDDLAEKRECAGCHLLFQDASLRARKEIRICVGCHRSSWTGYPAGIPSAVVCRACHESAREGERPEERQVRERLSGGEDFPWVRTGALAESVFFSHKAHVRYASLACTRCHEEVRERDGTPEPPTVRSMNACIRCHEHSDARNDCVACHK